MAESLPIKEAGKSMEHTEVFLIVVVSDLEQHMHHHQVGPVCLPMV